jgi:S-adenosylmethionine:diacylglycerol 3-amino-3-carboxypropyl transferase
MSAPIIGSHHSNLHNLALLAGVFERLDHSLERVDAAQYRAVVERLSAALAAEMPFEALNAVLNAYPATAELYENLHYAQAGLCRSPLQLSVAAEAGARDALQRARRPNLS